MAGAISIQSGGAYNLTLQLHDGADSLPKRVLCDLRRADQTLIGATFELPSRGNGLFQENAKLFPTDGTKEVFAFFRVMESDGTTESPIHSRAMDVYKLLTAVNVSIPSTIIPKQKSITANIRLERISAEVEKSKNIDADLVNGVSVGAEVTPKKPLLGDVKSNGRLDANVREYP